MLKTKKTVLMIIAFLAASLLVVFVHSVSVKALSCANVNVKKIIKGPVGPGFYNHVCIISNSVGVEANGPTTVVNSVIKAPICVEADGMDLKLENNILKCRLGVKFDSNTLINNSLIHNEFYGRWTNRPDIFGGN